MTLKAEYSSVFHNQVHVFVIFFWGICKYMDQIFLNDTEIKEVCKFIYSFYIHMHCTKNNNRPLNDFHFTLK